MQEAVPVGQGAMAAVVGLDIDTVRWACEHVAGETGDVVAPANMNSHEQTVISGAATAVERAGQLCAEKGAKRVMPLPVSAPFHCPLMEPAAHRLAQALRDVEIGALEAPVIGNVEAVPYDSPSRVKELLVRQVTSPVRWVESIHHAVQAGVKTGVEVGPGRVLAGLVRRINRGVKVHTTEDLDALKRTLEALA
jgi:[acyl-carrier-protein] S-malonyltransferase